MISARKVRYRTAVASLVCLALSAAAAEVKQPAGTLVFPPYKHSYGIRKATPKQLFMFFGPRTTFDDPQGLATVKMASRDDAATEHDDDEVVVYGVNAGRNQLIYNTSMWGLALYGSTGSGKDQFNAPRGVACDKRGNVYVVDSGNNRIVQLFNPKKNVHWVKSFNGSDGAKGPLKGPSQVGLDEDGHVYVTDTDNRRIVIFSGDGKTLSRLPADGAYSFVNGPTTIAVADGRNQYSFFRSELAIFCCDSNGLRLRKIGFDGKLLAQASMPKGYSGLYGAVDYYHNFWVTDKNNHCVLKFSHDLALLDIFGSRGEGDNQFIEPRGIAIYKRYGQTFVAEKGGAQYYWMGTQLREGPGLSVDSKGSRCVLGTDLKEYSFGSLMQISGNDTIKVFNKRMLYPGRRETYFMPDRPVDASKGRMLLRIEPTYSSYTYYCWEYPVTVKK
jgi:DNA-binding beta-propeller fold protein YncE